MKANPLVIALGLLVVLGLGVYYTSENPPSDDGEDKPTLVEVDQKEIAEVVIKRPDGQTVAFVRIEEDKWEFGGDVGFPADDAAVGLMTTNLAGMAADRMVEEQVSDWRPFGLEDDGNLAVTMTQEEGDPVTIIFGNDTPTGAGVFARISGDPRLFTVYNYVKTSFDKTLFDWRDKKMLQAASDGITEFRLSIGPKQFAFAPEGPGAWRIVKPAPVRADNFTVGELVRAVQNAEMTEVLPEPQPSAVRRALARPYAVAEINDGVSHTLTVARSGDDYFATTSDMAGVFAVSATFAESLDKDLEELRDRKLFEFGFDPISAIEIQDGDVSAVITKPEADWVLTSEGDRVLDSEKVQTLIDALRNLAAVEFLSERAGDQARRGLGSPVIRTTVKSGEDVTETVLLTEPAADRVFAMRDGEATTYRLERAQAEEVRRALAVMLEPPSSASPADATPDSE